MDPYIIELGFFNISWYSVLILIGLFIGGTIIMSEAKIKRVDDSFISNIIFWTIIVSIFGARLYFVAFHWDYYSNSISDIFKIWEGGLAIHGAIIFGIVFVLLYTWRYKIKAFRILDLAVPGLIIGQAIGRWGNFFNQEAYGSEVSRAFLENIHIPEFIINGMNINNLYYHPTFLYESLWCLLGFIIIILIRWLYKYLKNGQLTAIYFMWYSLGRFFIEMLRTDSLMLGQFKVAQIASVIMFIVGLIIFIKKFMGSKFEDMYREEAQDNEIRF